MTKKPGPGVPPQVPAGKAKKQAPIPPVGPDGPLQGAARPVISGAADSVMGAPLTPPTGKPLPKAGTSTPKVMKDDTHAEALSLGTDSQGGAAVPKQLDGKRRRPRK